MDEMMDVDVRPVAAAAGSMFARLSPELFEYILLQLDVLDLEVARGVCKAWRTTIKGMEARDKQCRYACGSRGFLSFDWLYGVTRNDVAKNLTWMDVSLGDEEFASRRNERIDIPVDRMWELSRLVSVITDNDTANSCFVYPCTCGRVIMGRISNGTVASTDFTEVHSRSLNDRWDVMSAHRNKAFKLCTAAEMIDPRLISSVQPLQNKHPVPWSPLFIHISTTLPKPRSRVQLARRILFEMLDRRQDDPTVPALAPPPVPFPYAADEALINTVGESLNTQKWLSQLHSLRDSTYMEELSPYDRIAKSDVFAALEAQAKFVMQFAQLASHQLDHFIFFSIQHSNRVTEIAAGLSRGGHIVGVFADLGTAA